MGPSQGPGTPRRPWKVRGAEVVHRWARVGFRSALLARRVGGMDRTTNGLILRPRMLAAGYSDDELRRMRAGRQLVPLRPGAYVAGGDERLHSPEQRHL